MPVTRAALQELATRLDAEIVGLVFLGGTEKLNDPRALSELGYPVVLEPDRLQALEQGLARFQPDLVYDLSDEPIVTYTDRFALATRILAAGISYAGPDFRFDPPQFANIMTKPSLTIAGTGKRIGKTGMSSYVGRLISGQEDTPALCRPCIVTMGRGGPPQPELIQGEDIDLTPNFLLNELNQGKHAASDHYEDALLARLTTIGCRRCGGGMTGQVFSSAVSDGAKMANELPHDFVIFEGSGAALPPIETDAWLMLVGAHQPQPLIKDYLGPYRIRKADLILMVHCDKPLVSDVRSLHLEQILREINPHAPVIRTRFRPRPNGSIRNQKVVWISTAPPKMGPFLQDYLETHFACEIVFRSHALSNRSKLRHELESLNRSVDTVLVELKAAAVDLATTWALDNGLKVVYQDNIPQTVDPSIDLAVTVTNLVETARTRFAAKSAQKS